MKMMKFYFVITSLMLLFCTNIQAFASQPYISRMPPPFDFSNYFDGNPEQRFTADQDGIINLSSADLHNIDRFPFEDQLYEISFDTKTVWPDVLPDGFDPAKLMFFGADPGCNVRKLHERGITGKNIGIGIIDQTLLVEHTEYADRVRYYNESPLYEGSSAFAHGAAVASIALGKTVGVAPDSMLYYIAEFPGKLTEDGEVVRDCTNIAKAIDQFVALNDSLSSGERIHVISISVGWMPDHLGAQAIEASIQTAREKGIEVFALGDPFILKFTGMGRIPYGDPNDIGSARPGFFLEQAFSRGITDPDALLIPMDYRCVASPTGKDEYAFYSIGGMSWVVPYVAGLYAVALEANPDISLQTFVDSLDAASRPAYIEQNSELVQLGLYLDAVAMIDYLLP